MSKKNEKDDNLTVSKVYETLKSPTFLRDLYWDILSGIKEKNTYKLMRETAEKLINQKAEALDGLTDSESDNVIRKTIVAQICSMSYAIDTVYSKILYMKLEKACRSQVPNLIKELRSEGKIPDEIWSKLQFKSDVSEPQCSIENSKATENSDKQEAETPNKPATTSGRKKRKETSTNESDKKVSAVDYKDVLPNDAGNKKADLRKRKLGGRIQAFRKKNVSIPVTSTPSKKLTEENLLANASPKVAEDNISDIPKNSLETDNKDSDAESEISVGHVSLASVSSVHTSDLSSYDDEISLSSEDEENGKKKRLSLKDLQKKFCQNGSLSPKTPVNGTKLRKSPLSKESSKKKAVKSKQGNKEGSNKKAVESKEQGNEEGSNKKALESKEQGNEEGSNKKAVESKEQGNEESSNKKAVESKEQGNEENLNTNAVESKEENEASTVDTAGSSAESVSSQSPKGLPKRVRKPNSRYSSKNILCTSVKVKERKKSIIEINTSEKNSSDELSPKKKKPRTETDDIDVETPDETQKMHDEKNSTDSDVKSPSKRYDSSDLYKPHSAVRSLTSRRTAPVTLYSTAT